MKLYLQIYLLLAGITMLLWLVGKFSDAIKHRNFIPFFAMIPLQIIMSMLWPLFWFVVIKENLFPKKNDVKAKVDDNDKEPEPIPEDATE